MLQSLPTQPLAILSPLAALTVIYYVLLAVYRIAFHPLAKFPGPKLAGLTYWYEFYYDVINRGAYIFKLEELHKQYGPVLRVNPNEVHIADSDFYSEIYHYKSHKTDRDSWYNLNYLGQSIAFTTDHDTHVRRRASVANYFSARSIRALEHRIQDVMAALMKRLHQVKENGQIVEIRTVYSALTTDIVAEYSFGKSGSTNFMSRPDFGLPWIEVSKGVSMNPFARHCKTLHGLMISMPMWLVTRLAPDMMLFVNWTDGLLKQIQKALRENSSASSSTEKPEFTVINELIQSTTLTEDDKKAHRLKDEASLLLGAGGDTAALTLARTTFHLLTNPDKLQKLRQELKTAIPDPKEIPSLELVSTLPYLNAVVEEGLRVALPVIPRSPRTFQDKTLVYEGWTMPPGVAISQSQYFVHRDPKIFPDPLAFDPDRWLDNPHLQKYQCAFSKGRRICVGINLAYAELRLGLASVFRRFEMELVDTTRRDVDVAHDFFVGAAATDSKGIQVKFTAELD